MRILCYGDSNTWGYIPNINGYSKNAVMKKYNDSHKQLGISVSSLVKSLNIESCMY